MCRKDSKNRDMIELFMLIPVPAGRANRDPGCWATETAEGGLKPEPAAGRAAAAAEAAGPA